MTDTAWRGPVPLSTRTIALLVAVIALAGAVSGITPDPIGIFWDDGVYLLTARALVDGHGYRYAYLPGMPPAIHYPPGFPLVLAALLKVTPAFPANVAILKMLNPLCLALGVFGAVRFGARFLGLREVPLAVAVGICALAPPLLVLTNVLLSESLFFAALMPALWLAEDAVERGGVRRAAGAGLAIALVALVRTVGGVLLPAAVAALWWRRRRLEAVVLTACAVLALAPWQLWVWHAARGFPDELRGSYGPYLEWVVSGYRREPALIWDVVSKNAADLWRAFGVVFAPRLPRVIQWMAAAVVLTGFGVGLAALARRAAAFAAFLALYAATVMLWPYNPERFVWAVWPLAGLVLLVAARAAGERFEARWHAAPRAAAVAVALLFTAHATYAARGLIGGWAGAPQRSMTKRLWPLVEWTAAHAGPKDVIASDGHVIVALYTGHTTVPVEKLTTKEYVYGKTPAAFATELTAMDRAYRPTLLLLSAGAGELDAVPLFARTEGAPHVVPLPTSAGDVSAYALVRTP